MQYKMDNVYGKGSFPPPPPHSFFLIGNTFFWCIFMCFERIWPFFLEMNNKRNTIFWHFKINRVIIPTQDQREPNLGLDLLQNYIYLS